MPTLDYPDRPKSSPCGGFMVQTRAGKYGNFEVVFPWPEGGIAHFWRNNDDPTLPWQGPTIFGEGIYSGVTVIESDNRAVKGVRRGNLEVVAIAENGDAEHWWRENGGAFEWRNNGVVARRAAGVPALAYSAARFVQADFGADLDRHNESEFFLVIAFQSGGFTLFRRRNDEERPIPGTGSTSPG